MCMWGQLRRNVAGSVKLMALASRLKEAGDGTGAGAGATRVEGDVGMDGNAAVTMNGAPTEEGF